MTQELTDLRNSILEGRYDDALSIVDELESMSKEDKINKITSYLVRIMIHLIKNQIEQRLTNSWAASISDSLLQIKKTNLKDNKTSYYIKQNEWQEMLEEAIEAAILPASVEVQNGKLSWNQLATMINREALIGNAEQLLNLLYQHSTKELPAIISSYLVQLPGGENWQLGSN